MAKELFTIGHLAEKSNLSIHTIRFYEKEGLIPFIERSPTGFRLYEDEHIEWLRFICCLRETGMSISKLKNFVELTVQGEETTDQRVNMLKDQRIFIEKQVDTLLQYISMINHKIDMYSQMKNISLESDNQ
ncbi:MerR family transcriptional regulator [Paenibacillus sp. BJ-4]|uniref:MerR family transcriptional regulator n=1 Tax=Paenibacillus sp. BJ-4 TaxID=2878097 RepID=UPI001CEFB5DC|nr:MerR family transcriptional regulator [Paenibacillus sp. BJ-4]